MLILRPASWLALLSRAFTFELSLAESPRANVEYDYVGKQSIPTTGLSPASQRHYGCRTLKAPNKMNLSSLSQALAFIFVFGINLLCCLRTTIA